MKNLFLLLIGLFLSFTGAPQPCLPNGIYFGSQATIDNFQTNYPNCTQIQGGVTINGGGITNLNGLSVVTYVGGYFHCSNTSLTNLSGLNSLTFIGGDVYFEYNPVLTNLSGLDNLTSISGELYFSGNDIMNSFTGLESMTSIGGNLTISHNPVLINLSGLNSLVSIGGHFNIIDNPALTNFTGLDSLTSIGSWLNITGNITLISLIGLNALTSIGADLIIKYDSVLTNCALQGICDYLTSPNGNITIYGNATGCNSPQEVEAACKVISIENQTINGIQSIYPNPSFDHITIVTSETPTEGLLSISNLRGQQLITRQLIQPKTQLDISSLPSGVYFVRLTSEKTVSTGKFIKQ